MVRKDNISKVYLERRFELSKQITSWRAWVKGLIHAGISGGTAAISTSVVAPDTFNFGEGLGKLISVAAISAIVSISKFLTTNPFPDAERKRENANE